MRNTNRFVNLIREIDYDGNINEKELQHFQTWVATNRNFVSDEYQRELIKLVEEIIREEFISDECRKRIIFIVENHLNEYKDEITRFYELKGIIKRMFADGQFIEKELFDLERWMLFNKCYVKHDISNHELEDELKKLIKQDCIELEEIEYIDSLTMHTITGMQFENKIKYLKSQVRKKKNIGIDLIDILDNEEFIERIHKNAEKQLRGALFSWSGQSIGGSEIVFISLVLIAIFEYDGSYYDGVRKTYSDLYYDFSDQKIEGMIRSVLNRYRLDSNEQGINRTRIINIALSNAVVPKYYLPDFFEFIYDIYKLNLDYDLSRDIYEEFCFVYEGIRSNMLSEGDDIRLNVTNKTYKLIKTTKNLIIEDVDSLIRLSIMISKLIDKRIWNKPVKIYNPYFRYGYDEWNLKLEEDLQKERGSSQFHSRWEPKFELKGENIYLVPPVHKVKAKYNYYDIQVLVFNGEELVYRNTAPDVREIIGGYKVKVEDILLHNPLGSISYKLIAKDEIYDSGKKLYRDFIVFDIDGKEIKNNTDYKGTAVFCYKGNHDKLNAHYRNENYNLASRNVEYADVIIFGENIFNFSALIYPGIFGKQYDNCYICEDGTEKRIPVYKEVDFLVFECEERLFPDRIVINEWEYPIEDFKTTITVRQGRKKYVIELEFDDAGIYFVSIPRIDKFEIAYDPDFSTDELKIDDGTYVVSVSTGMSDKPLNKDIDVRTCYDMGLEFLHKGRNYNYCIEFDMDIYRLSGQSWKPLVEDMWIDDVSQDSTFEVFGTEYDKMIIYSDVGQIIQELDLKNKGITQEAGIGFIITYKNSCKYLFLGLLSDDVITNGLYCYNRCFINDDETEIVFDSVNRKLSVKTSYYGRNKVFFEITDDESKVIYKSDYLKNGEIRTIEDLESFVTYNVCFYEKAKGLSFKSNTLLKTYQNVFYAYDDFVGRHFKINEAYYNQIENGEFVKKTHNFYKNYVLFKERVDKSTFIGEIYVKTWLAEFPLLEINPVLIEICSDILDESLEIYMTKDRDGLLMDFEHQGIMNSMDDFNAPDIFSYVIDINGVNEL